ncbi:MAG: hypothetical protein J07HX5_01055, partial [halophilic archaeon J07HX5]
MIERLRQPAYTGENRCLPCTVINTLLPLGLSGASAVAGATVSPLVAVVVGGGVLAVAMEAIWLRGYLVPGTPTLTKRYLPPWVLAWFGKGPAAGEPAARTVPSSADKEDYEARLQETGVIGPCEDKDDICLTASAHAAWRHQITRSPDEPSPDQVAAVLDLDLSAGQLEQSGDAHVLRDGDETIAAWPSETAVRSDLATAGVLDDRLDWESLTTHQRLTYLHTVRLFLEECPDGSPARLESETVESCCSSHDVA